MKANDIIEKDLIYITSNLRDEFNKLNGKNLLITGGAGFLGYYLIKSILYWNDYNKNNNSVNLYVYDNFARGFPKWISMLKSRNDINIVEHDISNPLPKNNILFSYIIHAASIASPIYYRLHPIETMDANVQGLRKLLDYTLKRQNTIQPVESFLFFSTSEIYGDPTSDYIPTPETYRGNVSCTGPRACYDESKRYGETLCVNFAKYYNLPIKIARPFNNYGPGLKINDRRVISDFARNIFANEDIVMFSDGSPTRTFCYVADAIVGYYKILINGSKGEAYNIGLEKPEISIKEFAELMIHLSKKHFGYTGKIVYKISKDQGYLTDVPNRRCPDITKARSQIGYSPSIDIDEGLFRTMYWYRDNSNVEEE